MTTQEKVGFTRLIKNWLMTYSLLGVTLEPEEGTCDENENKRVDQKLVREKKENLKLLSGENFVFFSTSVA